MELISGVSSVPSLVLAPITETGCSVVKEDSESLGEVTSVVNGSLSTELSGACKKINRQIDVV